MESLSKTLQVAPALYHDTAQNEELILLSCSICKEKIEECLTFSCFHVICLKHMSDSDDMDEVAASLLHASSKPKQCPIAGCIGTTVSFDLCSPNAPYLPTKSLCQNCLERPLDQLCSSCDGLFCFECAEHIHSFPAFRNHYRTRKFEDVHRSLVKRGEIRVNECSCGGKEHALPLWLYCPRHRRSFCKRCSDVCCSNDILITREKQVEIIQGVKQRLDVIKQMVTGKYHETLRQQLTRAIPALEDDVQKLLSKLRRYINVEEERLLELANQKHEIHSRMFRMQLHNLEGLSRQIAEVNQISEVVLKEDNDTLIPRNATSEIIASLQQCREAIHRLSDPMSSGKLLIQLDTSLIQKAFLDHAIRVSDSTEDDAMEFNSHLNPTTSQRRPGTKPNEQKSESKATTQEQQQKSNTVRPSSQRVRELTKQRGDGDLLIIQVSRLVGPADLSYLLAIRIRKLGSRKSLRIGFTIESPFDEKIHAVSLPQSGPFVDHSLGGLQCNSWGFIFSPTICFMHNNKPIPVEFPSSTQVLLEQGTILGMFVNPSTKQVLLICNGCKSSPLSFASCNCNVSHSIDSYIRPAIVLEQKGDLVELVCARFVRKWSSAIELLSLL